MTGSLLCTILTVACLVKYNKLSTDITIIALEQP